MTSIQLTVTGAHAVARVEGLITAGMVGIPVTITCDESWDGLVKTLVCKSDTQQRCIYNVGTEATVAPEVLVTNQWLRSTLYLGLEGRDGEGNLVIPSTYAYCGVIQPGAQGDCPQSQAPDNPVWAQILGQMGDLSTLQTEGRQTLVEAINEAYEKQIPCGYYIPVLNQISSNQVRFQFVPSRGDMSAVAPRTITISGYTLTQSDKQTLVDAVLAALPTWTGGAY